jgi:hypothetical protein
MFYQTRTVLVALAISSKSSFATTVDAAQQQRHKVFCSNFYSWQSIGVFHIFTGY